MSTASLPRSQVSIPRLSERLTAAFRRDPAVPGWSAPALAAVAALAAFLTIWALSASGTANDYYTATVLSGTKSWSAFFFGSIDSQNFITVDKPPLSLWAMGLSARLFGFSSWSVLLPEAVFGVASVLALHRIVKRTWGPRAAIMAALVLAVTPVSVVVSRYNLPDSLLVLLMVLAAGATLKGIETGRTRWIVAAGALIGLAFNTKMLQAYVALPALALAVAACWPGSPWQRLKQLAAGGASLLAFSASWPLAVALWPGQTPYIGGSSDGTVLDLVFGYNGFGRIFGEGGPPAGAGAVGAIGGGPPGAIGGGGGPSFGGGPGLFRLFNEQVGGQIAWLLPAALVCLGIGLWLLRGRPRTDLARAGFLLWGTWALTHVAVFSFASGIFHPYYVSALAPAVAALVGGGLVAGWRWARGSVAGALLMAATIEGTGILSFALLQRTPDFVPGLRWVVLLACTAASIVVILRASGELRSTRIAGAAAAGATAAMLAGPFAYSADTVGEDLTGGNVLAGPVQSGGPGAAPGAPQGLSPAVGLPGGEGGSVNDSVLDYLLSNYHGERWLVAVSGSHVSAPIILETGDAVMTMGGFNGQDPAPTAEQLASYVSSGELRFVLLGGDGPPGQGRPPGASGALGGTGAAGVQGLGAGGADTAQRDQWVTDNCARVELGAGATQLYDCSGAAAQGRVLR